MKRVLVFGIFDGIHDGHRHFFKEARVFGDELVVVVGRDNISKVLKGKIPRKSEEQRIRDLKAETLVDLAVLGDEQLSTYKVVEDLQPHVICLGYDQEAFERDLRAWIEANNLSIEVNILSALKPDELHSSILYGKNG